MNSHKMTDSSSPEQLSPYPAQGPRGSSSREADLIPPTQPQVLLCVAVTHPGATLAGFVLTCMIMRETLPHH